MADENDRMIEKQKRLKKGKKAIPVRDGFSNRKN